MGQSYQSYQDALEARAHEAQEGARTLKEKAEDAASSVAEEGAKAMKAAGETASNAIGSTKRFVEEQPLLAIGAVALVACAAGVLWKLAPRRRNDALMDRISDYVEPGYRALRRRI